MTLAKLPFEVREYVTSGLMIQNFTQCVTELVMNSIDARATAIKVKINFNSFTIEVSDNGDGMSEEQLDKLCIRYMTSKCHSLDELNNKPRYYGYRGETLASIRNIVEELIIISKDTNSGNTFSKIFYSNDSMPVQLSKETLDCGTTVKLKNVFNSYPVRHKLIREKNEIENIRSHLKAMSLINPSVAFWVSDENTGNIILERKACYGIATSFLLLLKNPCSSILIPINAENRIFKITGFIGRDAHFDTNDYQFIYINKRILSKTVLYDILNEMLTSSNHNVSDKYSFQHYCFQNKKKAFTEVSKSPIYIINIQCPYSEYSIDFKATETLIDFQKWNYLLKSLAEALNTVLNMSNFIEKIETESSRCDAINYNKNNFPRLDGLTTNTNAIEAYNKKSVVVYGRGRYRVSGEIKISKLFKNYLLSSKYRHKYYKMKYFQRNHNYFKSIPKIINEPLVPFSALLNINKHFFSKIFYCSSFYQRCSVQKLQGLKKLSPFANDDPYTYYSHKEAKRNNVFECVNDIKFYNIFHKLANPEVKFCIDEKFFPLNISSKHSLRNGKLLENKLSLNKVHCLIKTKFSKRKHAFPTNVKMAYDMPLSPRITRPSDSYTQCSFSLASNSKTEFYQPLSSDDLYNPSGLHMKQNKIEFSKMLKLFASGKSNRMTNILKIIKSNKGAGVVYMEADNYQQFNVSLQSYNKFTDYVVCNNRSSNKNGTLGEENKLQTIKKPSVKLENGYFINNLNGMSYPKVDTKNTFQMMKKCFFAQEHTNSLEGKNNSRKNPSALSSITTMNPEGYIFETFLAATTDILPPFKPNYSQHPYIFKKDIFNKLRIVKQVDYKFITAISCDNNLYEKNKCLLLLFDQHAVDERIRLETLLSRFIYDNGTLRKSELTTSLKLKLRPELLHSVKLNKLYLKSIGITVEAINNDGVSIGSLPTCLLKYLHDKVYKGTNFFEKIIHSVIKGKIISPGLNENLPLPSIIKDLLCNDACKGAIKFGNILHLSDCKRLIQNLAHCKTPFQCAHGRPLLAPIAHITLLQHETESPTLGNLAKKYGPHKLEEKLV